VRIVKTEEISCHCTSATPQFGYQHFVELSQSNSPTTQIPRLHKFADQFLTSGLFLDVSLTVAEFPTFPGFQKFHKSVNPECTTRIVETTVWTPVTLYGQWWRLCEFSLRVDSIRPYVPSRWRGTRCRFRFRFTFFSVSFFFVCEQNFRERVLLNFEHLVSADHVRLVHESGADLRTHLINARKSLSFLN